MKRLLFLFCSALFMWSCSSNKGEDPEPEPTEPKEYIVALGIGGEVNISMEEEPLSKVTGNTPDVYGIQVREFMGATYEPYAYGVFDDISKMRIRLLEGHLYSFEVTMIPNYGEGIFNSPFMASDVTSPDNGNKIDNLFHISQDVFLCNLKWGIKYVGNTVYNTPNEDRYYGDLIGFTPTSENQTITIDMKRSVFGLKLIVENAYEGIIDLKLSSSPTISMELNHEQKAMIEDIFTLSECGSQEETTNVNIYWTRQQGDSEIKALLMNQKVTFKRKKITVITIHIDDTSSIPSHTPSIGFNKEEGELVVGDNIEVIW